MSLSLDDVLWEQRKALAEMEVPYGGVSKPQYAPAEINAMREQQILCESLVRSEGWKLYDAELAKAEERAYSASTSANDPHSMAKHMGAFKAIRDLRTWPVRNAQLLRDILQAL